jgi:hypothetical protein
MKITALLLLGCFGSSALSCPNDGSLEFLNVQNGPGYYLKGYYGSDSFMAYIYGKEFSKAETSDTTTKSRYFFIDGIAYQQIVARRKEYLSAEPMSEAENLEAHYKWELAYVKKQLKAKGRPFGRHTSYGVVEIKNIEGKSRKFFIWEATLSGAKQYYLTTSSSFGVLGLTLIGVKPSQEELAKTAIDNYMYRYKILSHTDCKK